LVSLSLISDLIFVISLLVLVLGLACLVNNSKVYFHEVYFA
jgi:hypothetical protein